MYFSTDLIFTEVLNNQTIPLHLFEFKSFVRFYLEAVISGKVANFTAMSSLRSYQILKPGGNNGKTNT